MVEWNWNASVWFGVWKTDMILVRLGLVSYKHHTKTNSLEKNVAPWDSQRQSRKESENNQVHKAAQFSTKFSTPVCSPSLQLKPTSDSR